MSTVTRKLMTPRFTIDPACDVPEALVDACHDVAEGIEFDATALPVHEFGFLAARDGMRLDVAILVPHRDENAPTVITRSTIVPWEVLEANGAPYLVGFFRWVVSGLMAHEVDEAIKFRGARVFDPHQVMPTARAE